MTPDELLGLARDGELEAATSRGRWHETSRRSLSRAKPTTHGRVRCVDGARARRSPGRSIRRCCRARSGARASLELNAALGNAAWVSTAQHNLGWVELHLG